MKDRTLKSCTLIVITLMAAAALMIRIKPVLVWRIISGIIDTEYNPVLWIISIAVIMLIFTIIMRSIDGVSFLDVVAGGVVTFIGLMILGGVGLLIEIFGCGQPPVILAGISYLDCLFLIFMDSASFESDNYDNCNCDIVKDCTSGLW